MVGWRDAMAYAKWAGKRLPTEAEWEKAARGGLIGAKYPWGNVPPNGTQCNLLDKNVDGGNEYTTPVGSFPANGYGLYDMAGNATEWCLDEFQLDPYAKAQRRNPFPEESIQKFKDSLKFNKSMNLKRIRFVYRGGGWGPHHRDEVRVDFRSGMPIHIWYYPFGFRCVKNVNP